VVSGLVTSCAPRPKTLVLDLSRQPKVSSTILDGLRELDTEMAGLGVRVVFAELPDSACDTARRWPWWQELAAQGRYAATLTDAVRSNSN
jgi:sulfate permease, SulP family